MTTPPADVKRGRKTSYNFNRKRKMKDNVFLIGSYGDGMYLLLRHEAPMEGGGYYSSILGVIPKDGYLEVCNITGQSKIKGFSKDKKPNPDYQEFKDAIPMKEISLAELHRCIEAVDRLKEAGRPSKELASAEAMLSPGKSAGETARVVEE
jgi:hypothetical protein